MTDEKIQETQEAPLPDTESLKQELAEAKARSEEYLAGWQRAQADFQNFKRRAEEEWREATQSANGYLVASLLPVLDDLDRALQNATALAGLTWVDGVRLIHRKLLATLEAQGLKEISAVGQAFDPRYHEAVLEADGDEGKVLAELQKGYTFGNRVVRPALVKVGCRPAAVEAKEAPPQDAKE